MELTKEAVEYKLEQVSEKAQTLFYFLPPTCWMTERNIGKALGIRNNRAIAAAKRELKGVGLITIEEKQNRPGRTNPVHFITKSVSTDLHPIPEEYAWTVAARAKALSPYSLHDGSNNSIPDSKSYSAAEISKFSPKWDLLQNYSAAELNKLPKLQTIELLMECGLLVLPSHFPKLDASGDVSCSCGNEMCDSIGKHPAVKGFRHISPETYAEKRSYFLKRFKDNPSLNVGFKLFGFSVLDVDFRHGGNYSLGLLQEEFPGLDETLTVETPGGLHLYTATCGFNQGVNTFGMGLDVRSDKTNGFIVAPPSVHRSGERYSWQAIDGLHPIPEEWMDLSNNTDMAAVEYSNPVVSRRNSGKSTANLGGISIPPEFYKGYVIPEGQRNATLFKIASRERGRGASKSQIYNLLVPVRDTFCEPSANPKDDVSDKALRDIAKSVCRYPTNADKFSSMATAQV